jgi:hypothetical protein
VRAKPIVYEGEAEGWTYQVFLSEFQNKWQAVRNPRGPQLYVKKELLTEEGFLPVQRKKNTDPMLFDTAEECETRVMLILATELLQGN